jgi:hypothetical protein
MNETPSLPVDTYRKSIVLCMHMNACINLLRGRVVAFVRSFIHSFLLLLSCVVRFFLRLYCMIEARANITLHTTTSYWLVTVSRAKNGRWWMINKLIWMIAPSSSRKCSIRTFSLNKMLFRVRRLRLIWNPLSADASHVI